MKCMFVLLLLMLPALAPAAPAPVPRKAEVPVPKGQPPRLTTAKMGKPGELILTKYVPHVVKEDVTRTVIVGGKKVLKRFQIQHLRYVPVENMVKLGEVEGYDLKGKRLDEKALIEVLRKRTIVAVSADGEPVAPVYLSALKEGAIVLVFRSDAPTSDLDEGSPDFEQTEPPH